MWTNIFNYSPRTIRQALKEMDEGKKKKRRRKSE